MAFYDGLSFGERLRERHKNDPWALADELMSRGIPLPRIREMGLPVTPKMKAAWKNRVKSSGISEIGEGGQSGQKNPFKSSGLQENPRGGQSNERQLR